MKILSIIVQILFVAAIAGLAVYMFYDVIASYFEEQYGINIKKTKDEKEHLDIDSEDCNCGSDDCRDCDNGGVLEEARR